MKTKFFTLLTLLFSFQSLWAQTYQIDSGHSAVQIQVQRFGVVDVVGRFKAVEGSIEFNDKNPGATKARAVIQVDSYDANNIGGEQAVKSPAFLDAANYPEITFKSESAIMKDGQMYLVGDLTIHGTTNEIELPCKIIGPLLDLPTQKQSIAFIASTTINRQDYGVTFDRALPDGTQVVSNEVKISLNVLAITE